MKKIIIFGILLFQCKAFAWNGFGHETIATIAERLLEKDTHTTGAIRDILGIESFAMAATFADRVKSEPRFKPFSKYHYLTVYKKKGKLSKQSASTVLKKFSIILKNPAESKEKKIIALRYIMHVVGDVHQPLHVDNENERGGSNCIVQWQPKTAKKAFTINLHKVWDSFILKELMWDLKNKSGWNGYFDFTHMSEQLMNTDLFKDIKSNLSVHNIDEWFNESLQLHSTVYPKPLPSLSSRSYCKKNKEDFIEKKDLPILGSAYLDKAKPIVAKRIIKASIRLAVFLQTIFKDVKVTPKKKVEDVLKDFLDL